MFNKKPEKKFYVAKMTPPEKDAPHPEQTAEDEVFELCNAASSTDCTGLIPTPPQTEAEMESYMRIYDYQPKDVVEREEENPESEKK